MLQKINCWWLMYIKWRCDTSYVKWYSKLARCEGRIAYLRNRRDEVNWDLYLAQQEATNDPS